MSARASIGFTDALPFWASLALVPIVWLAAVNGGWWIVVVPLTTWTLFALLDLITGPNLENVDPQSPDARLIWHRIITWAWGPVQCATLFGVLGHVSRTGHLANWEALGVAFGLGVMSGTIGIVYAHELMHRKSRAERWLGDILMAMALYGHFRSEHLLVHHPHVGTPRDAVTARYGEGFHRFFARVLWQCGRSAWRAEAARLRRAGHPIWHRSNPFWRYAVLQVGFLVLSYQVGGLMGLGLFCFQALIAIWQLELVNYVEHYGLTRQRASDGRYEPAGPHHAWNASQKASNWLLINLQRHSDHHMAPGRHFPLLQNYSEAQAPQLPYGYPVMTALAMVPPLWRWRMNPRVRAWRLRHYPEIKDWSAKEDRQGVG